MARRIDLHRSIPVIALAGNPNTGKTTIFNRLTGLRQHTGNWPGKTVLRAEGETLIGSRIFRVIDLPGTYTLSGAAAEERVAREFICSGDSDVTLVIADATALERNLSLVLQVMEITPNVVVAVNLVDEAHRKGLAIDVSRLQKRLGVPVVATSASTGAGIAELLEKVAAAHSGVIRSTPLQIDYGPAASDILSTDESRHDEIMSRIYTVAAAIAADVVTQSDRPIIDWDQRIDDIVTSRLWGFPIMFALLGAVFWLTVAGANVPSELLATLLFRVQDYLTLAFEWAGAPDWLHGILVLGLYRGTAWVISVMLPPMAIFFPIFTLLEDFGYLPRVAFNLDRVFRSAGAHGKQSLTMGMGFGCNAAAILSTRIIESPRERLIAILTNNFVPCNGRFPILITMASLFAGAGVAAAYGSLVAATTVMGIALTGIATTLAVSWTLSKTVLRGIPSHFTLELPPYRKPQVIPVIIRSLYDRTLLVLGRAIVVAAPAGAITWILANIEVGGNSLLGHGAQVLTPLGHALGMDGMILVAFVLGLPANEIVLPIMIMGYMSSGVMMDVNSLDALKVLLVDQNGWTWLTALNLMLFSLLHYPCGTTLISIYKETRSLKWSLFAALMPLTIAVAVTFIVAQVVRGFS